MTEYIGFYPSSSWKLLIDYPIQSKIVDNANHEYNASLIMNVTPQQLDNTLNYMGSIANHPYDIDDYNCTDFALNVFNQARIGNPIEIQKFPIPGGISETTSTPGALYTQLQNMLLTGNEVKI